MALSVWFVIYIVFRHIEPFARGWRVWQTDDRHTERPLAIARSNIVRRGLKLWKLWSHSLKGVSYYDWLWFSVYDCSRNVRTSARRLGPPSMWYVFHVLYVSLAVARSTLLGNCIVDESVACFETAINSVFLCSTHLKQSVRRNGKWNNVEQRILHDSPNCLILLCNLTMIGLITRHDWNGLSWDAVSAHFIKTFKDSVISNGSWQVRE